LSVLICTVLRAARFAIWRIDDVYVDPFKGR
jgi:hypothetical protein